MNESRQRNHPLEGKFIIYEFGAHDYAGEGWALALHQLRNGIMEEIYHPVDHVLQPSDIGKKNVEELLRLMEERGIKEVYSVFHLDDFFGIPAHWYSLHEPEEKPKQIIR